MDREKTELELIELLRELQARNWRIRVEGQRASVRSAGAALTPTEREWLREALAKHREHLVRLYRERETGVVWRKRLRRASAEEQEAWCLLAAGREASGLHPAAAEWLAWWETV